MMISILDGVENIVGKGDNAGYQQKMLVTSIFPFSRNVVKMLLPQGCENLGICGKELRS